VDRFTEDEYKEVEMEAIAHGATIRHIRASIERAIGLLDDNVDCNGGLSETDRIEVVSILGEALEKYR